MRATSFGEKKLIWTNMENSKETLPGMNKNNIELVENILNRQLSFDLE